MAKNNRKNRKLSFIRTKNRIRSGGIIYSSMKVSDEALSELPEFIGSESHTASIKLSKLYKLNIDPVRYNIKLDGLDFVRHMKTVLISFKVNNGTR
jgi:hypothetical protein